ncbi:MAG TPA: 50S ribosomal protein L30, partial [Dehalococcoidia bacterium]|nr:50S ribosomal protein L30 [Dehalococcoidia bacterium]
RITWKRSAIGCQEDQKQTIRSLGFRKLGQTVEFSDSRTVRGMIHKVRHLVLVDESDQSARQEQRRRGS